MRRLGRFTFGKDPVPIVQEAGWAKGSVWTGAGNLAITGIRSPDLQPVASRYTDWAILARLNLRIVLQSGTRPFPFISFPVRTHQSCHSARCVCATDSVSTVNKCTTLKAISRTPRKSLILRMFQAHRYQTFLHLTWRHSLCMPELCTVQLH